jgi:hypothetical protein
MAIEALVLVGLACALALLAGRFGHDSRETPYSKEEQLAALGVAWGPPPPVRPDRRRRLRRLRRALAAALVYLADRLDPTAAPVTGRVAG